ncbi:MAG: hypothetical protein JWQ04_3621 [Pedosphaera sp.]|nr:hypothetical protein [Pedosphaera sp.]
MKTTRRPKIFSLVICICWLAGVLMAQTGNWPGFRGLHGDGVAEAEKSPVNFGASSNVLWKTESLRGHSSPVIWQDRIFLTGTQDNKLVTLCMDRLSGKKIWEQSLPVEKLEAVHAANSPATPTPVTDGKAVYVYFGSFGLLAYDFEGKELWRKPLPVPQTFAKQGTGTSPVLADGKLLVFLQLGNDSQLLAVGVADGHEIWKAPMPDYNMTYATPVVWKENEKSFAGVVCARRFSAFQLADGREAWWVNDIGWQACSTPVVAGDRLVISTAGVQGEAANITPPPTFEEIIAKYDRDGDGLITDDEISADLLYTDRHASQGQGNMPLKQALRLFGGIKKDAKLNREQWNEVRDRLIGFGSGELNRAVVLAVRTGGKKDVTDSQVIWKEIKSVPEVPSPLVWDGRIYLIRSGGILACRELATGRLIYENRIDSPGGYFASPVVAAGRIYLASDRGTVTVVKAGDAFEVLARNELGDPIIASPVIVANTLYVRSTKQLWAFAEKGN